MEIGINRFGNKFPYILNYIIPKPLMLKENANREGFQIYKWLWFGIKIDKTIRQQPLSGSPEGSPKSAEPTSDNGKRCTQFKK